ncbi:MAG: DUF922 domain-containing protein [Sphingobacteriaceae bacterium]|nr:DUF922 domain-containing protein [Sphingobacteriaceae bacterium]
MRLTSIDILFKKTKILSLSLFLLLLFSSFLTKDEDDILVWEESRILTWDDFRGKPAKRMSAASTHYDIFKTITERGKITIEAVFFCNKSWKKVSWINQQVLEHEQKHFDIVELYARKLRKLISETKYSSYANLKTVSDSLYAVIDKEMDVYQDKYDDETDASMNGDKQREWNKKIPIEIKALSLYKNSTFTVSFSQ